jgi:predicted peroxiredoxin
MPLPPLTIIVAGSDPERLHAALSFAAAAQAMGGATRIHLHGPAVALLQGPTAIDARYAAKGLPTLAELLDDMLELGVAMTVCQSGLALADMNADRLDARIGVDGPIGALAQAGTDRILVF